MRKQGGKNNMEEWCYTASDITNERIFLKDIICDNK